jgi:hypothetical protein
MPIHRDLSTRALRKRTQRSFEVSYFGGDPSLLGVDGLLQEMALEATRRPFRRPPEVTPTHRRYLQRQHPFLAGAVSCGDTSFWQWDARCGHRPARRLVCGPCLRCDAFCDALVQAATSLGAAQPLGCLPECRAIGAPCKLFHVQMPLRLWQPTLLWRGLGHRRPGSAPVAPFAQHASLHALPAAPHACCLASSSWRLA